MRIVFMGTPAAAIPSLERLVNDGHDVLAVYTQPDRPAGRGRKLAAPPVKLFAVEKGIRVLQPETIRTDEATKEFRAFNADVAVVVAYGKILPTDFLYAFENGAINVHFSLLPKYRGAAPVNWAIVRGEERTGVTTMKMDEGLDTGDILLQEETKIGARETAPELMERLALMGAELLSKTVDRLGEIAPVVQDHSSATLAPILKKADGRIDWSLSAIEIERRIRGFQPFPTAFTLYRGARLTLWRVDVAAESGGGDEHGPGVITTVEKGALLVECGNGTMLNIEEVQPEGKRRQSIADFINGVRPVVGESFGDVERSAGLV